MERSTYSVSYTHLDVYKRQVKESTSNKYRNLLSSYILPVFGSKQLRDITHFLTHKVIKEIPSFMRRNEKQLNIKMCINVDK